MNSVKEIGLVFKKGLKVGDEIFEINNCVVDVLNFFMFKDFFL